VDSIQKQKPTLKKGISAEREADERFGEDEKKKKESGRVERKEVWKWLEWVQSVEFLEGKKKSSYSVVKPKPVKKKKKKLSKQRFGSVLG
jgi:hypothetical protein